MQCQCNDLRRIARDIITLSDMSARANAISGRNSTQKSTVLSLSGSLTGAVTPGNCAVLAQLTRELNTKLSDKHTDIAGSITRELMLLRNKQVELQKQDKLFHAG